MEKALKEQPDYVVFNGHVGALMGDHALRVKAGQSVRMYLGNPGPSLVSSFHVVGGIFNNVYGEGGSTVNATVLASGEVDKVFLYYAPKILGAEAVPFLANTGDAWQMRCVDRIEFHRFGEDFAIGGYLRDPYVV